LCWNSHKLLNQSAAHDLPPEENIKMSEIRSNLRYTQEHEWVRRDDGGVYTVGITDYAQSLLGDLVYVELPEGDAALSNGDQCAVVESVKAATDVYAPLSGTVTEANEVLGDASETINQSPYDDGWLWRMTVADASAFDALMDAEAYREFCEAEDA